MDATPIPTPPSSSAGILAKAAPALAVALVIGIAPMFICACGHMNQMTLSVTGPATALAWWSFVFGGRVHVVWRIARLIAVALTSLALAKNLADVLWFGHDPIFSEIPALFGG